MNKQLENYIGLIFFSFSVLISIYLMNTAYNKYKIKGYEKLDIINKIEESGYLAYIVGGMVRDYVMKRDSYDVDICTSATPKDLIKIFDDAILPKEKYGAVTLKYKDVRYEITTFRKELKYVKRRPVEIAYTNSFYEDMKRRDFTINSMVMNKDGQIIDIFDGKKDIDNRIIRCVGNAKDKFTDDIGKLI